MLFSSLFAGCQPQAQPTPVTTVPSVTTGTSDASTDTREATAGEGTAGEDTAPETTNPWTFVGCRMVEKRVEDADSINTFVYVYNPRGDEIFRSWDYATDGAIDGSVTQTYDETSGRILTWAMDSDGDGDVERTSAWTYDDAAGTTVQDDDVQADGIIDARRTLVVDASGLLVRQETDAPVDGFVDWAELYQYDVSGRLVLTENVSMGVTTSTKYNTYGSSGEQLEELIEYPATGYRVRTTFTYDADLHLIAEVEGDGDDGIPEVTTLYSHSRGF